MKRISRGAPVKPCTSRQPILLPGKKKGSALLIIVISDFFGELIDDIFGFFQSQSSGLPDDFSRFDFSIPFQEINLFYSFFKKIKRANRAECDKK